MNKIIFDNKTLAIIIIILHITLLFLFFGILFLHDSFDLNADDTFLYIFYILVAGTLGSFLLQRKSVPIRFKAPFWVKIKGFFKRWKSPLWIKIKDFFKSLGPPLWIIWIILLIIFNAVLLGKIISFIESYSLVMGTIGMIASILAIIYALYSTCKFNKMFDFRVKSLTHYECFPMLSKLLTKDVHGLGLPPEKHISIANRNSLIPAFWVDPLEYRGIKWRKFINALHEKMQDDENLELDLHLPCHPDTDSDADEEYFRVMGKLSKFSAENILEYLNSPSIDEPEKKDRYSKVAQGKLPTCYKLPVRLLSRNNKSIHRANGDDCNVSHFNSQAYKDEMCGITCKYREHCFDENNLKTSLLIIYCSYVMELFEKSQLYHDVEHRISLQNNQVDDAIQFPLLIFFDSKTWSRERTKVLMTVMHEGVIKTGEFASQLLFPWEIVKGLRETISYTSGIKNEDERGVTNKFKDIVKAHKNKREEYYKLLRGEENSPQ